MDFIDSFSEFHEQPKASLVERHYKMFNDFLAGRSDEFLDHVHDGKETILFFTYSERERGGPAVKACLRQVRAVLSRVPVGTTLTGLQVCYHETADMAYAIMMEKAVSNMDKKTVVSEHRTTLIWRKVEGHFKLFVYHSDTYDRRDEAMSELLRSYERDAVSA